MQYITVNSSPIVDFSANVTSGCFPLPVQFSDHVSGSGDIIKWQWDFGDGEGSSDSNPQHIYKSAGNFNVSLRTTNSLGCIKSKTKSQFIKLNTGVVAGFNINMSNSCKAPATINFTNNSTGSGALFYQWDFGDGSGSTLPASSHIYTTDRSYSVRLIVKNSAGCADTIIMLNAITLGNTKVDFSIPGKVCQGSLVNITNTSISPHATRVIPMLFPVQLPQTSTAIRRSHSNPERENSPGTTSICPATMGFRLHP